MTIVALNSLYAPPALAEKDYSVPVAGDTCAQVVGYAQNHCATPGYETPMTLEQILANESLYKGRIILHFGPDILDANLVADILSNDSGVPTLAIPGGPKCGGRLLIDGQTNPAYCFTQANIDRGELGALAVRVFAAFQERQRQNRN